MKTYHKEELYIKQDNLTDKLFDDESIFFDIETTGFSPSSSSIYLIGCARKKGNHICIDQFFAENPSEEKLILNAFIEILKQYKTIISFNGVGFDVPFLKAKCEEHNISETFASYNYIDIFKLISKYKFLFRLENYKQKTIEKFLGLKRNDLYSGGDLINVYYDYVKNPSDDALESLCLHNYEDVLGMTELLPILSYIEVFNGQYSVSEMAINNYKSLSGEDRKEVYITLRNDYVVPKKVSCQFDEFYISINKDITTIRVSIYEGELYYFYPNYKEYYYLPKEDIAIHKSVATFVDKEYREKCHAYNCYNRKTSEFVVQKENIMNPQFKTEYNAKDSYFELTDDFSSSDIMLRRYVDHVFRYYINNKKA